MSASFSFDIVSTYDKAEMNNVLAGVQREIANRYDFKNTPAALEWLGDKTGFVVTGSNTWQVEAIIDLVRKHLANRGQSSKVLDLSKPAVEANLRAHQDIPFIEGLSQERAKQVSSVVREHHPKLKPTIQGEAVRLTGASKDELQAAMQTLKKTDFDFPLSFTNYR